MPPPDLELVALSFRKHRSQMHQLRSWMAPCCVTQDKSFIFSVPQHPHLYYGVNDRTYRAGLLQGFHDESIDNALRTEWPVHTISCHHLNMVDFSLFTFITTFSKKFSPTPSLPLPSHHSIPFLCFYFLPSTHCHPDPCDFLLSLYVCFLSLPSRMSAPQEWRFLSALFIADSPVSSTGLAM